MTHGTASPVLKMGVPIPNGKLGMWLFLGTEIMFFAAFIGTYVVVRMGSPGWPTDPHVTHINVWAGGINTFVLICSSVSVVLAHEAMHLRNYVKATNMMVLTLILACVFLGIKSYEYYGKYSHDILPSHIAESPQQAIDKMVKELDAAVGLPAIAAEQATLKNDQTAGKGDADKNTAAMQAVEAKLKDLAPVTTFKLDLKAGKYDLKQAEHELHSLQGTFPALKGVHDPHVIVYGNLFSSTYFTMTGFHALHVLIGMGMFLGIIALGKTNKLGERHEVLVENCGLYWHFVDLVWIFLFPLIYII